jgi:hypothetical protein
LYTALPGATVAAAAVAAAPIIVLPAIAIGAAFKLGKKLFKKW